MRRGLCVFSVGTLGIQLSYAFLPQAVFWPFAAFFVCICLVLAALGSRARLYGLWMLAGAVLGLLFILRTAAAFHSAGVRYAGHTLRLIVCVETVQQSYVSDRVQAQLRVEQANGQPVSFRVVCLSMPECAPGDRVAGVFCLSEPDEADLLDRYTDGIALEAEYLHSFVSCGQDQSFLGWARRLQQTLSEAARRYLDEDTGAVLAAMTVGDRSGISSELSSAYRGAGLSHILVVSGMHVSILCGGAWHSNRMRRLWVRRLGAVFSAVLVAVLVGVTGCTPSVLRAGIAVWISALGVWVNGQPDSLTSLSAAGLLLSAFNSYALCDVGCQLSFAAVAGTLAGVRCAAWGRELWQSLRSRKTRQKQPEQNRQSGAGRARLTVVCRGLRRLGGSVWENFCISACASAATFPVLVLRGLSASPYALVSGVTVVWLAQPILLFGVGAAVAGCFAPLKLLSMACAFCGGLAVFVLNGWARMVSSWPGAQIYFETEYAALVCLLLLTLWGAAALGRVRLRASLPGMALVLTAAILSCGILGRDLVRVTLVGTASRPAAVVTQGDWAVLLFYGGSDGAYQAQQYLDRLPGGQRLLVVDLQMDEQAETCALSAEQTLRASEAEIRQGRQIQWGEMELELLRTESGCGLVLTAGGRRIAAVSGTFSLVEQVRVDLLLASSSDPAAFDWRQLLSLGEYDWMRGAERLEQIEPGQTLALRPGGGERLV